MMPSEGNVVKDFYIKNVRIKICDDYCREKTKNDVDKTLAKISNQVISIANTASYNMEKKSL